MVLYTIEALDVKDYNFGEIVDIHASKEKDDKEKILKDWAEGRDEKWTCFIPRKVNKKILKEKKKEIDEEIEKLKNQKKIINEYL